MKGIEHYRRAEELISKLDGNMLKASELISLAQLHATLALAVSADTTGGYRSVSPDEQWVLHQKIPHFNKDGQEVPCWHDRAAFVDRGEFQW